MIEKAKVEVSKLLNLDGIGHGMDYIDRVVQLSLDFEEHEHIDKDLVILIAN